MTFVTHVRRAIRNSMIGLPPRFYDSFDYTFTGNNLTHPLTVAVIANAVATHRRIARVGVDVRLGRFTPDVVGFTATMEPAVFIDYESPNSSDARIPPKDVDKYRAWCATSKTQVPYVIVTTLPDYASNDWQLRWTTYKKYLNYPFRGRRDEIRKNPFKFWYGIYRKKLRNRDLTGVYFLNISGNRVTQVRL